MRINKKFMKIWSFYSFLLMLSLNINIFFWDFFSGSDTRGFGVIDPYFGLPMFYVYMIGFFNSFIVVLAILKYPKFGMGSYIWIPYAVIGFFVETYFELDVLVSIWSVVGYCIFGLITGFSADITFKLLNTKTKLKYGVISGITGIIMSLTYFILITIALGFFYQSGWVAGSLFDPGTFLGTAYFGVPWMIINAFFGGFSAFYVDNFSAINID
jgi:hypothetical protein